MQLTGKVVLVTGAEQGIGRAMSREFAAAGADVAINWLDDDGAAQRVAHEVRAQGRRAILVQADVSRIEQVSSSRAYLAKHNATSKPFVWTKSAAAILAKLDRCPVPSV